MTDLVACVSSGGKGTWLHVSKLCEELDWNKIFIIGNTETKENFQCEKTFEFIMLDENKTIDELQDVIKNSLDGKINDTEIAVNLVSGSGKEHMALLSALLKLGLGIRLMALTKEGVKEI
jgi:hypothetical protein